jgi:hypothetical protein
MKPRSAGPLRGEKFANLAGTHRRHAADEGGNVQIAANSQVVAVIATSLGTMHIIKTSLPSRISEVIGPRAAPLPNFIEALADVGPAQRTTLSQIRLCLTFGGGRCR